MALYDAPGDYPVVVKGKVAGKDAALPVVLSLPEKTEGSEALPVLWARGQVKDRMIDWASPRTEPSEKEALVEEITGLGLEHRLVTQWTSFVAVAKDRKVATAEGEAYVPTPAPASTAMNTGAHFGGSSAPEPATWAVLGCLTLLGFAVLGRRRTLG